MKRIFLVSGLAAFLFLIAVEFVDISYIPIIILITAAVGVIFTAVRLILAAYKKTVDVDVFEVERFLEIAAVSCLTVCICGTSYSFKMNNYNSVTELYDGKTVRSTLQIVSEEKFTESGLGYFEAIPVYGIDTKGFRIKIFSSGVPEAEVYDYITGDFEYSASDGDYYYINRADGIVLYVFTDNITVIERPHRPISFRIIELSRYIERTVTRYFGKAHAFVKAVLLGDRSDMSSEDFVSLRKSGLLHVTAVSGLHVGIAAAFVLSLTSFIKSRYVRYGFVIPVLLLLAAVTGFSPSVIRAVFMITVSYFGTVMYRKSDSLNVLGAVLMVYLFVSPFSVYSASLLLSFSASLGIILFSTVLQKAFTTWWFKLSGKYLNGFGKSFVSTISVSLASTVFTVPVSMFLFGSFSVAGIITNLFCLWLIQYVFILAVVVVMLGWIPFLRPIFSVISLFVNWGVSYVMWMSNIFSETVFSDLSVNPVNIILSAIIGYIVYVAFGLKKKKCDNKISTQVYRVSFAVIAAVVSLVLMAVATGVSFPKDNKLHVVFVDVGQGVGSYISYNEKAIIFDCGGSKDAGEAMNESLREHGIKEIECVVLSHLHSDHVNGIGDIFAEWDIDKVYIPYTEVLYDYTLEFNSLALKEEALIFSVINDTFIDFCGIKVEFLTEHFDETTTEENEANLVSKVSFGDHKLLFTGDITADAERRLIDSYELHLDSDVLCVPHHGSDGSSCPEFLAVVSPEISVLSVGKNSYGLPDSAVVNRLLGYGDVLSTMILGTVELVSDGTEIEVVE